MVMPINDLTYAQVAALLVYTPQDGCLFWKVDRHNKRVAGRVAGTVNRNGYINVRILNRGYKAHRLAFLLMTGNWPADQIDHIDGNRSNNRWNNLRECTARQNSQNRPRTTGGRYPRGVNYRFAKNGFCWVARFCFDGKICDLGRFETAEKAHEAHLEAVRKHFGDFCPVRNLRAEALLQSASAVL